MGLTLDGLIASIWGRGNGNQIMAEYEDAYWWSKDGLRLHYRRYPGPEGKPPLLCLPGLTRNAGDFEGLANRLAGRWPVIAVDLRGRGESAYAKDPMTYVPLTYLQDIILLIAELRLEKVVAVGTSLGGILTMLLAATDRERLAGAVLNDVGPVLDPAGLERIRTYVGRSQNRSEEHTSELQSLLRISYAVFCWKK